MSLLHSSRVRFQILLEHLQGLDFTSAKLTPKDLGFDEKKVFFAGPSGDEYTAKVFDDLAIKTTDAVIDIGCGKGSALRQLARYPFSRVDGIEISPLLAQVASKNFTRLGPNAAGRSVQIFCLNALQFRDYGRYNVIYLYSPFPNDVLAEVMDLINAQNTSQQERVIVYNNPVGHDVVLQHGFHLCRSYPDLWGNGIKVYSNRADNHRLLRTVAQQAGLTPVGT
jgi:SAM-dependent methyltransferase